MSIAVRRATVADAALVATLNADVQALHAAALPWRFKPPRPGSLPYTEAAAWLGNPAALVFIADFTGEPAGYTYAEVNQRPLSMQPRLQSSMLRLRPSVSLGGTARRNAGAGAKAVACVNRCIWTACL